MTRPKISDCHEAAVDALVGNVMEWFRGDPMPEGLVRDALLKATRFETDGYEIAKGLEGGGWHGIDADLVEILDSYSSHLYSEHSAAVRKWAAWEKIEPKFAIGTPVMVMAEGKQRQAVIHRICKEDARYTIRVPELGHVEDGLGTHGFIMNFEEVERQNP